jgi:hypothetical protein
VVRLEIEEEVGQLLKKRGEIIETASWRKMVPIGSLSYDLVVV